ncbi:MAG: hypothetical protein EBQ51_01375 [Verrucomicrobia bacterium]|nr:hypothetical protein [Pseudomonadota bacterium]NBS06040.1 hypothetical protein [Verrucomicrobiota bacterium]NBS50061.1 hypothetical protein [Verrucomicrobiota bacterium]NBS78611.1 hypothetical protein [bacterium]NBY65723.1 hypothetical protein [Verrucomicrobiota bacterium]
MWKQFRVNAGCWASICLWMGVGGLWAVEIPLRTGTEEKTGAPEVKAGGWKEDLGRMGFEVPIEDIEKGQIVGQKWLISGGRPGFLGAKVFFLASGEPQKVARSILLYDPTGGKTLPWEGSGAVKIFQKISRPPAEGDWTRFREALGGLPFDTMLQVQDQREGKLHLHPEEVGQITQDKVSGWVSVLMKLVQTYHRGGWKETIGVPSGPGAEVDFDAELREVLKENGPVRDEFRRLLTALAYGGRDEKEKIEVNDYWQLMEVDKTPTVALGCGVARAGVAGRWEVADMNYYVSSGYFGSISFYGIWPYSDGRSLVCRMDVVETNPGQLAQATARMVAEGMFMGEVRRACEEIKKQSNL